jgi:hypothetical protein
MPRQSLEKNEDRQKALSDFYICFSMLLWTITCLNYIFKEQALKNAVQCFFRLSTIEPFLAIAQETIIELLKHPVEGRILESTLTI